MTRLSAEPVHINNVVLVHPLKKLSGAQTSDRYTIQTLTDQKSWKLIPGQSVPDRSTTLFLYQFELVNSNTLILKHFEKFLDLIRKLRFSFYEITT